MSVSQWENVGNWLAFGKAVARVSCSGNFLTHSCLFLRLPIVRQAECRVVECLYFYTYRYSDQSPSDEVRSRASCRWLACGPADATATPSPASSLSVWLVTYHYQVSRTGALCIDVIRYWDLHQSFLMTSFYYRMQWTAEGSVFGVVSLWSVFFVCEISWELLNEFAPNSHGKRVWSVIWTSLKVKVTTDKKTTFLGPFGGLRAIYVW